MVNEDRDAVLASVITASLDCIIVIDEQGCVIEFNPASEATFGYSRSEALDQPIADLIIPPHLRDAHHDGLARYLGGAAPSVLGRRVEVEAMRKDGSIFPVELAITEVHSLGRRLFTASLRDLTDRVTVEHRLRDFEAQLKAFLDHAPIAMYLKGQDDRYAVVNRFMAGRFDASPEELIGKTPHELLDPAAAAEAAEVDRRIRETRQPQVRESAFETAVGTLSTLAIRFPICDESGEIIYIGGVVLDTSAQKRAEEELERSREALHQSEKMNALGSLLAGVSHELNNPLAIVMGEAVLMEEEAAGTGFERSAERIRRAAERCARIVQTFLAMARQKRPERSAVDINAAVQAAVELTAYGMRSNGIEVMCELAPGLPSISAEPDHIQQVVINLLINAQQALQEHDGPRAVRIETSASPTGHEVTVRVSDTGPGIPPDVARRIFDPFFTTKPLGSGTGIGLSFSQGVVEAHGGKLSLAGGNGGATFVMTLPAGDAAATPPANEPERIRRAGRALIVDDEPELAELLARFVSREGFEVEVAGSGREAMDRVNGTQFDLILSDLRMPDMDGPALHSWLVEHRPELAQRLGFLTGDTLGPAAVRFIAEVRRPVAEKPFTRESVRALIDQIVRREVRPG